MNIRSLAIFAGCAVVFFPAAFAQQPPVTSATEHLAVQEATAPIAPTDPNAPATPPKTNKINDALSKLSPAKAQLFDTVMRKNIDANRSKQQQLRGLYLDIRNNFISPTFNKEDFLVKSKQARDLQNELRASLDSDLAEIASQYTQEERQIIFNALPARYTRDMIEKNN